MKKKILAVVAALAIMTVGTTAFAADSPSATTASTVTGENGFAVEATVAEAVDVADATTQATTDIAAIVAKAGSAELNAALEDANKDVTATVLDVLDLNPVGEYTPGTAVKLTVANAAIKADKHYVVLHQKSDNTWETLPATVEADGKLTFTTTSFSAFAIVELTITDKTVISNDASTTADSTEATTTAASTDAGTSPKTGETTPVALFALLACVAGALACSKKSQEN
jgi:hypothetical protein